MSKNQPPDGREPISEMTTGRLSVYLRCLTYLEQAHVSATDRRRS